MLLLVYQNQREDSGFRVGGGWMDAGVGDMDRGGG